MQHFEIDAKVPYTPTEYIPVIPFFYKPGVSCTLLHEIFATCLFCDFKIPAPL